ncbi:UNVERIFIED_CONTAM: hypothetical protein GTU68_035798 [Idotea baltica]|nr:hypothetical protein [Idotea baltica]
MKAWINFCDENNIEIIFGENYVKEYADKKAELTGNFKTHLIGPLQSNKVKKAVEIFDCIQSVHSEKVLKLINKEAEKLNKEMDVFLQVNISEDEAKSGFQKEELVEIFNKDFINKLANINIAGLMCITAFYENKEDVRPDFIKMCEIKKELELSNNIKLELSMGMSADYQIAIEEGASMVRIGSSLFGERL